MAGCGCGGSKNANANIGGDTLGYRAFLPNGEVVPPVGEPPFFSASEAMTEVTNARGGTVRRIRKGDEPEQPVRHLRAV